MMIPNLAMTQEPRLQRLFALVGKALIEGIPDEDALTDVLMDIAPEFVPPDEEDNMLEWERFVDGVLDGRPTS